MPKYYKVSENVTISGDLNGGDVFDASEDRFKNHDIDFLLKRGDIAEVVEEKAKREETVPAKQASQYDPAEKKK